MMGLATRNANCALPLALVASKYSYFKGFHRSALLAGYNFVFPTK
jgi:hypothetical protein